MPDDLDMFEDDPYEFITRPRLVFIVTAYNVQNFIAECLKSVMEQNGNHWRCIVIDDASTDATWSIILDFIHLYPTKIAGKQNTSRQWKMANLSAAIETCGSDEVIIELDGDDYLLHNQVALEIAELHRHFDTVWTQHRIDYNICPDWHPWYSTPLPDNWTRTTPWRPSLWTRYMYPGHLRTFKRRYFDLIRKEDLQQQGEWVRAAADAVYYTAIIELTPPQLRYYYARPCSYYRITVTNDTLKDFRGEPQSEIESQSQVGIRTKHLPEYSAVKIPTIFIPIYQYSELEIALTIIENVLKNAPFSQICIGLPGHTIPQIPISYGVVRFYNIHRILANIFNGRSYAEYSRVSKPSHELFWAAGAHYILRNTNCTELFVITSPYETYKTDDLQISFDQNIQSNTFQYFQKGEEAIKLLAEYIRSRNKDYTAKTENKVEEKSKK